MGGTDERLPLRGGDMSRLLVLCATPDDFLDFIARHPEHQGHSITAAWPFHFDGRDGRVAGQTFDTLIYTAAFMRCPRADRMLAAARTRLVAPAHSLPVVYVTGEQAELMGLGGSDA